MFYDVLSHLVIRDGHPVCVYVVSCTLYVIPETAVCYKIPVAGSEDPGYQYFFFGNFFFSLQKENSDTIVSKMARPGYAHIIE
jgi:hypothetical protein